MSTSHSRFQHPAAPHGDIVLQGNVVNLDRFAETTHTAHLDIENPASSGLQRKIGVARIENRFVQTDCRLDRFLQAGMKIDFVIPERLLDHQQIEGVKFSEMLDLIQCISRIRVYAEYYICPARTDFLQHIQIPSRLHLDLDAPVSRRQLGVDLLQKLFWTVLYADRDAASNLATRSSQQLPEWHLFLPRLRIPHCVFQRRLCHTVSTDPSKSRRTITA